MKVPKGTFMLNNFENIADGLQRPSANEIENIQERAEDILENGNPIEFIAPSVYPYIPCSSVYWLNVTIQPSSRLYTGGENLIICVYGDTFFSF